MVLYHDSGLPASIAPYFRRVRVVHIRQWYSVGSFTYQKDFCDASLLVDLKRATQLDLSNTTISDISPLAGLPRLTYLGLENTRVTDVSRLSTLHDLKQLNLARTSVTDISPLAALHELEELDLRCSQVRDVSPLAALENLKRLNLAATPVDDLWPLVGLPRLEQLDVGFARLADEEVQRLREALPDCTIAPDPKDWMRPAQRGGACLGGVGNQPREKHEIQKDRNPERGGW